MGLSEIDAASSFPTPSRWTLPHTSSGQDHLKLLVWPRELSARLEDSPELSGPVASTHRPPFDMTSSVTMTSRSIFHDSRPPHGLPSPSTPEYKLVALPSPSQQQSPVQLPPLHAPPSHRLGHDINAKRPRTQHWKQEYAFERPYHAPPGPSPQLEQLPQEILRLTLSYLDYESLIWLSSTNHFFHRWVDPSTIARQDDKLAFVMHAANHFPQHRPCNKGPDHLPGNFECYICYRVRGPDHFDSQQASSVFIDEAGRCVRDRKPRPGLDREIMLRRFCIECGVKTDLHTAGDCLRTKTGSELWICRCRQVWVKPDVLRCPHCSADCPLRPRNM